MFRFAGDLSKAGSLENAIGPNGEALDAPVHSIPVSLSAKEKKRVERREATQVRLLAHCNWLSLPLYSLQCSSCPHQIEGRGDGVMRMHHTHTFHHVSQQCALKHVSSSAWHSLWRYLIPTATNENALTLQWDQTNKSVNDLLQEARAAAEAERRQRLLAAAAAAVKQSAPPAQARPQKQKATKPSEKCQQLAAAAEKRRAQAVAELSAPRNGSMQRQGADPPAMNLSMLFVQFPARNCSTSLFFILL